MAFLGRARDRTWALWVGLYESPWAELVTAAGTVIGSAIISISGGLAERWWLILTGSTIIVLGLVPTWSRSTALSRDLRNDDYQDARADVAKVFALSTLAHAASVESLDRAARVDVASEKFYDRSTTVRVIYYAVSGDRKKLVVEGNPAGRSDQPRTFDASEDRRGELGLERLDIEEPYEFHGDTSTLPEDWGTRNRPYVAFVSVPVRVGRTGYGLISVDSTFHGELLERDGESLGAYAAALEFYLTAAERGRHVGNGEQDG